MPFLLPLPLLLRRHASLPPIATRSSHAFLDLVLRYIYQRKRRGSQAGGSGSSAGKTWSRTKLLAERTETREQKVPQRRGRAIGMVANRQDGYRTGQEIRQSGRASVSCFVATLEHRLLYSLPNARIPGVWAGGRCISEGYTRPDWYLSPTVQIP